jgi:tyrosinase
MDHRNVSRRVFLEHSMLALGASALPFEVFGQTIIRVRPEWETFKTTSSYDALLRGIKLMKANTNPKDAKSWTYWTNIHVNNCPHEVPYFLAWHRGYMFYFERQLRTISGDSQLVLPYWDYYKNPQLPAEFTNPNGGNPLYVDRVNTNVQQALSMAPFAADVLNFQRGQDKAFEPTFEDAPHNPVHNLIGNAMADMISPVDPIFWLHHANVDRLWVAWAGAGGGRKMPPLTNTYWSGKHVYTASLNMLRSQTYSTRTALYYRYQDETMPTSLPVAQANAGVHDAKLFRVQANKDLLAGATPSIGSFRISGPRQTGDTTFALGGALDVGLSERSVSVQLPVSAEHSRALVDIANDKAASIAGAPTKFRSAHLILDGIEMSELGRKGGYFYKLYLNIPSGRQTSGARNVYLGTLGPFEIHAAAHHGSGHGPMRLRYKVKRAFAGATATELGMMSVSFVRVSGNNNPGGGVIGLGEVRLEAAAEPDGS